MHSHESEAVAPDRQHLPTGHWRIELLGGLRATSGRRIVTRFAGRPVAALLARLALFPRRSHGREELIELLWPGIGFDVGRNRLRQVLSTLRSLLEPPTAGSGVIIVADRHTVRLNEAVVACDALEFEAAFRDRRNLIARDLYRGELLPGFHDEWVVDERRRLEALHEQLQERESHQPSSHPDAASAAPPANGSRLPVYFSSFVGRDSELRHCADLVHGHRLVTVIGSGGCGKTRFATEVAREIVSFEPVIFAPLADCRSGSELADRVRAAARLPPSPAAALQTLATHLGERRALLVLDNFEQLVDHGGPGALVDLLAALPLAHALVTSRRVLRLAGEEELVLSPLPLPEIGDDLATATHNPAVALFVDRARSVRGDFRLSSRNRDDLLRVSRTLEGLPLAIEIAASRIRTYSLPEMRAELEQRFKVLTRNTAQAVRDPRHASLHSTIDWSWRLLSPRLQRFLAGLSVFRGGFSAAEVQAVAGTDDTHDLLDLLVADSLLDAGPDDAGDAFHCTGPHSPERRFSLLEAVREFAVEHLPPGDAAAMRRAHRACFLGRALALAERHLPVGEASLSNYVEAIATALADGEPGLAVALFLALKPQWEFVGVAADSLALMQRAAQSVPPETERFVPFLAMLARLLLVAGHSTDAVACAERAVRVAGDAPALRAEALFAHTRIDWVRHREAARVLAPAREGLRLAEEAGLPEVQASALSMLGAVTLYGLEDPAAAEHLYQRAEHLYLALGNGRGALQCTHGRMGCLYMAGQYPAAIELGAALESQAEAFGNVEAQLVALNLLAASHLKLRSHQQSLDTSRRETRLAQHHHKVYNIVHGLWNQGYCLARLRRPQEAAAMMAFSVKYWTDHLGPPPRAEARELEVVRRLVSAQIGAVRCREFWARGSALSEGEGLRLGRAD